MWLEIERLPYSLTYSFLADPHFFRPDEPFGASQHLWDGDFFSASLRWRFFLSISEMERKNFSQNRTWPPSQLTPISPDVSWFFLLSLFKLFIAYLSLPSSKSWVVNPYFFFPSFSKYFLPITFLSQSKCFLSANIFLILSPHPSPNTFSPAIFLIFLLRLNLIIIFLLHLFPFSSSPFSFPQIILSLVFYSYNVFPVSVGYQANSQPLSPIWPVSSVPSYMGHTILGKLGIGQGNTH